jgi:hypothetical protein
MPRLEQLKGKLVTICLTHLLIEQSDSILVTTLVDVANLEVVAQGLLENEVFPVVGKKGSSRSRVEANPPRSQTFLLN